MSSLQDDLRKKGHLVIGDQLMVYAGEWKLIKPGDLYLAHSEGSEPDVLTCRRVEVQKRRAGRPESGKIYPKERGPKLYDLHEVVKITFMPNPNINKEEIDERIVIDRESGRVDVVEPESDTGPVGAEPNEHQPERSDQSEAAAEPAGTPVPIGENRGTPRPVPRPPGRGGSVDYTKAGQHPESAKRDAGGGKQRRGDAGGRS